MLVQTPDRVATETAVNLAEPFTFGVDPEALSRI